jgi:hypothetical protein
MESGLVIHEQGKYMLRVDNLGMLISELEKDVNRTLEDLRDIASGIDNWIGI